MENIEYQAGQFMVVGFNGKKIDQHIKSLIEKYHVSAIILFSQNIESPLQLVRLTGDLQQLAKKAGYKYPLLICLDQEDGIVRRITNGVSIQPGAMAVAATGEPENAKKVYAATARELKSLGINWDLAPDADVNSNPENPVIGVRSFGDNPFMVGKYVQQAVDGLQDNGVIACLKHFPGHGNTRIDSHLQLPIVNEKLETLEKQELVPFVAGIKQNVKTIMVAHILFKCLDNNFPASLSKKVITNLLRKELAFQGLIVTDDLEMKAVAEQFGIAKAAVKSLNSGVDLVMVAHDYRAQIQTIKKIMSAIQKGLISQENIKSSATRIANLRKNLQWSNNFEESSFKNLVLADTKIAQKIYAKSVTRCGRSITLLKNQRIFVFDFRNYRNAGIIDQDKRINYVSEILGNYNNHIITISFAEKGKTSFPQINREDAVIVCTRNLKSKNSLEARLILRILKKTPNVVVIGLRNPYDWLFLPSNIEFIATYEDSKEAVEVAISSLFGYKKLEGHLPVKIKRLIENE